MKHVPVDNFSGGRNAGWKAAHPVAALSFNNGVLERNRHGLTMARPPIRGATRRSTGTSFDARTTSGNALAGVLSS